MDALTAYPKAHSQHNPILSWCHDFDGDVQVFGSEPEHKFRNVKFDGTEFVMRELPQWVRDGDITLYGETGLDPIDRRSTWGYIDVDSLVEHGYTTGQAKELIEQIIEACRNIPWIQVQRSKGGNGIHIYFRWHPDRRPHAPTRAHHARNCKRVALLIEQLTGIKFIGEDKVADCIGVVAYLMTNDRKPDSFKVESEATEYVPDELPDPPPAPTKWANNDVSAVPFDDDHMRQADAWAETGYAVIPSVDSRGNNFMLIHCRAPAEADIEIVGEYDTVSPGTKPTEPNACAYPVENGGWVFMRYGEPNEKSPWFTSAAGNTVCLYNVPQDVETIVERRGVKKHKGNPVGTVRELADVLKSANGTVVNVDGIEKRSATLTRDDGQYTISTAWKAADGNPPDGWHHVGRSIVFITEAPPVSNADPRIKSQEVYVIIGDADNDGIRIAENFVRMENGELVEYTEPKLDHALKQDGLNREQREHVKVNAPRLRRRVDHFKQLIDIEGGWLTTGAKLKPYSPGEHPTWDALDDIFNVLTPHLPEWYLDNGITTGAEVARLWTCLMIREYQHPLFMLVLVSKLQGTGKTWWAHSRKLLFTGGQAFANGVLSRNSQFNAHVLRAVFAHVEECDIHGCYDQLKPLISDEQVESEAKFVQATVAENRCHFVQTTNKREYIAIDPDDTRIVVVPVERITKPIGRKELKRRLNDELPHYLNTLMTMPHPDPAPGIEGRLWLPIIHTPERQLLMDLHDPVARFIREYCTKGSGIPSTEFDARFQTWQNDMVNEMWSTSRIHRSLPDGIGYRTGTGNKGLITGLQWVQSA